MDAQVAIAPSKVTAFQEHVAGAVVTHLAHERNNPYFIKDSAAWFNGDEQKAITADDGTFRLGVMPGPGYLLVRGPTPVCMRSEKPPSGAGATVWPLTVTVAPTSVDPSTRKPFVSSTSPAFGRVIATVGGVRSRTTVYEDEATTSRPPVIVTLMAFGPSLSTRPALNGGEASSRAP